jgi:hypothetical protein
VGDQTKNNEKGGEFGTYGGEECCKQGIWLRNLREIDNLEDEGVDGMIILKWILKISVWRAWTGLIWFRTRRSDGLL